MAAYVQLRASGVSVQWDGQETTVKYLQMDINVNQMQIVITWLVFVIHLPGIACVTMVILG